MPNFLSRYVKFLVHMRQRMVKDNRFGLCLGAGVSADFKIPTWKTLIERIARHPSVQGESLLKISESLTAQSQFLYQKYLQSVGACEPSEDEMIQARRVQAGWLKIVHQCLYENAADTDADLRNHPYLRSLVPLIKKSAMTINYNFDDTVERSLYLYNAESNVSSDDKGFEVVWQPTAQFRRNQGVIYHPNGFLPRQTIDGLSEQVVFMEQEFADQLVDFTNGHYVSILNHLAKHTIVFIGLSLSDANLKHLLRVSARHNPGNFHYHIHWCTDEGPSGDERRAISRANFTVYNLVTLFLTTEEIREMARYLVMEQEEFNGACDEHLDGIRTDYRYYLTGPVGGGKTAVLEQLKSVATFEEWVDRKNPLLARPHAELLPLERSEVDSWINSQFRKKNRRVSAAQHMVAVIDRSPLDPLYFVKDDDSGALRAKELLHWMVPQNSPIDRIAPGHLILFTCDTRVLELRLASRNKTYTAKDLDPQIESIENMWRNSKVSLINTTNMTVQQVVSRVLEIILFDEYVPVNFHSLCEQKALLQ